MHLACVCSLKMHGKGGTVELNISWVSYKILTYNKLESPFWFFPASLFIKSGEWNPIGKLKQNAKYLYPTQTKNKNKNKSER